MSKVCLCGLKEYGSCAFNSVEVKSKRRHAASCELCQLRILPEILQMLVMCDYGTAHGFEFMVWQIAFLCGFFYNFGDFAIMYMADVRVQMVFNLVVESPCKPIYNFVL